jgi:ribonuclease J
VIHSGDFKLDLSPVVGEPFDAGLWGKAAEGGVQALICDSTNVFVPHPGRSEASLAPELDKLIGAQPGLVAATTFASNIARLKMLAEAGARAGRSIVPARPCHAPHGRGRARDRGAVRLPQATISPEDAGSVPRDHLMLLTTGSQGERRAATAQLSRGKYLGLELKEGDTFLFSSKTIPGNERSVTRIINNLSEMGVEVIDDATDLYHVSGHANRPDLQQMHALIAPRMVIPMHGEHRHLRAHARLAEDGGFAAAIAPNGTMLELSGDTPRIVDRIETGRVYLDGRVKVGALDGVIRDRIRMALNGHVVVTVILDEDDAPAGEPWCEIIGLSETGRSNASLADVLEADLDQFLGRAGAKTLRDDDKLEEGLRRIVRQSAMDEIGKKPEVTVVISRLA